MSVAGLAFIMAQALPPVPLDAGLEPAVGTDIIVSAPVIPTKADPMAKTNAEVFAVTQKVDNALIQPVSFAYNRVMPKPLRAGIRNVLHLIKTPVLVANNVLQLRPKGTARLVARAVLNGGLGMGGLFDVASRKPFNLPYVNNGFGYTLGYYGVKSGPYFYLPLVGPTTLRDAVGGMVDAVVNPNLIGSPFTNKAYTLATGTARSLDHRIEYDTQFAAFRDSGNAYISEREWYLKKRAAEIKALRVDIMETEVTDPTAR